MSRLTVTNFNNRNGSPFNVKQAQNERKTIIHEEVLQKTHYGKQKEKHDELLQKVNKKTAEYQANKPSSGVFTEIVTHGAFTVKNTTKDQQVKNEGSAIVSSKYNNGLNGCKSLLGYPSSANDLALDAKTDLESDPNISKEVKEKIIEKLFTLVSMVQHVYESKVRVMTEFEKFKDTHLKNESRREKEHSEQLYKLNMNFQNEVVQAIQRLKSELDIARNLSNVNENERTLQNGSVDFDTSVYMLDGDTGDRSNSIANVSVAVDTEQSEHKLGHNDVITTN